MSRFKQPAHSRGAGCLYALRFLLLFSISGIFSDFQHEHSVNFIRQCVSINRVCAETYKRCFLIQHRIPCLPAAKLAARCRKPHRLKRISPYPEKRQRTEGRFENMRKNRPKLLILPHFKRLRIPSPFGFFDFAVSAVVDAASVFRKPRADFPKLFNRRFGEVSPRIRADVQNHVSAL